MGTAPIHGVTRGLARLQTPPNTPRGEIWRYGYGFPFQASPTQAVILANIHRKRARVEDFEVGSDAIVFDNTRLLSADRAVEVSRIHREFNPNANEPADMVKQCPVGGFVPLGAKRDNGSPHPHVGTGFGIAMAIAYAVDDGDLSKPYRGVYLGAQSHIYYELLQFAFDGVDFRVTRTDRVGLDQLVPGRLFLNCPMRMAIPDGDDLLAAGVIGLPGSTTQNVMGTEASGSGVVRWRRGTEGWRAVSFHPVAMEFVNFEPSLIRDTDGALLFSVRPGYTAENKRDIVVWRSRDNAASWQQMIHVKSIRYQSPITINQAADGAPYVVCNHFVSAMMNYEGAFTDGFSRITSREMLCLWPLNERRDGLLSPHVVSFPRYHFGPPPVGIDGASDDGNTIKGRDWTCDHPSAGNVRLADGQWHNLLCHRLLAQAEVQGGIPPTPHSGLCIEEVLTSGPARPEWKF
jgi:hypothetical protein